MHAVSRSNTYDINVDQLTALGEILEKEPHSAKKSALQELSESSERKKEV